MNETQHLRNDRACKGRRYQEFKDQALGRKGSRNNSQNSRPGDRNSLDGNNTWRSGIVFENQKVMSTNYNKS